MQCSTKQALAIELDVSPRAVGKWMARTDWPFGTSPPWDAAAVADWHKTNVQSSANRIPKQLAAIKLTQDIRIAKAKADALESDSVPYETYTAALRRLAEAFVQTFRDLEATLPGLLQDQELPEMRKTIARHLDNARLGLSHRAGAEQRKPKQTRKRTPGRPIGTDVP